MREADIECRQCRRFRATMLSDHRRLVAPNLLERDFNTAQPNQVWIADILAVSMLKG